MREGNLDSLDLVRKQETIIRMIVACFLLILNVLCYREMYLIFGFKFIISLICGNL